MIEEIAAKLIELNQDMDFNDYIDGLENEKAELEKAIEHVKACAQNSLNPDYWRTLWAALCGLINY